MCNTSSMNGTLGENRLQGIMNGWSVDGNQISSFVHLKRLRVPEMWYKNRGSEYMLTNC
jgi:hypothetical protein